VIGGYFSSAPVFDRACGHRGGRSGLHRLSRRARPADDPRLAGGRPVRGGAAWIIGKTALGLRSDYLAIATLGISEIIIAVLKNEDWLARGVKNVTGLASPLPVPYEVDLQQKPLHRPGFHAERCSPRPIPQALLRRCIDRRLSYVKIALCHPVHSSC
jgi:hypothetical protein